MSFRTVLIVRFYVLDNERWSVSVAIILNLAFFDLKV